MSTGEDEASPRNGRLRPRKSISTSTPNPQLRAGQKTASRRANYCPKRSSTSSKPSSLKQDDLSTQSDTASPHLFMCPYCDSTFHARQSASKHARRIHLSATKQDNFIKCLYCNTTDADSNAIIKHMVDSHPNQYFACLDCHTRFLSTTELAEHKLNVCDKQKLPYRCKLRQKSSTRIRKNLRKNQKKMTKKENVGELNENAEYTEDIGFNGIVISCELKPSETHDAADIEDKITTNLILPSAKTSLATTGMDKSAVIVFDDLQWNKRIPPNFTLHNTDADQILFRLGVVHRSPRVGESKKDLIRMMDEPNEKFEKCFDTSFYSKVAKNVQENLAKFVDGTLNFNPNKDSTIKTRKSKASVLINTAEGFPILLAQEQFSRHLFDGFMPRALAPKHKWKWDSTENDKSLMMLLDQTKRDSHANNCIITLISSLDIWTQLRMKSKFDEIFKTTPTAKKTEKQNKIGTELKEILESRDIPTRLTPVVQIKKTPVDAEAGLELPSYLGLSASRSEFSLQPAVLSGEWVRPRCFVCCACGEQTSDARALTQHLSTHHPNAQVQHYEIVGETLLSADILKHLYVPLNQMSNRTRPPRGFRDCTKCKKSVTLEDLHQHMLDCAGDTPAVRRKCRYRPFGVRRRRPRLPDNIIRKKMRKDMRTRRRQKSHMRPRPRNRTEVGDAETIRKMIADLPAKRNRITLTNVLRPKRTILKVKKQVRLRTTEDTNQRPRKCMRKASKSTTEKVDKKQNDTDNSSTIDEDDQPLKVSATQIATRSGNGKQELRRKITINKNKKKKANTKKENKMQWSSHNCDCPREPPMGRLPNHYPDYYRSPIPYGVPPSDVLPRLQSEYFPTRCLHPNQLNANPERLNPRTLREMRRCKFREEEEHFIVTERIDAAESVDDTEIIDVTGRVDETETVDVTGCIDVTECVDETEKVYDSEDERIDVTSSCSSTGRQYSGVDDNSNQRSMGHPTDPREGGHQNNNVSQMPNIPLKHSIASLTSATEEPDSLTPYLRPYILPSPLNQSFIQGSLERKDFENEVTAEKVDKPPLSNKSAMENYLALKNISVSPDSSHRQPFEHGTVGARLPLDPIELQARAGQMPSPIEFPVLEGSIPPTTDIRQQLICNEIEESITDTTESNAQKTDEKADISRIKTNKVRKVLNIENCIAKIRTKKGLPVDKTDSEAHDSRNPESESQKTEKTADVPATSSTPKLEPPLGATLTTQDSEEIKNNEVTNEECVTKHSNEDQPKNPVNDQAPVENKVSHAKKTPLRNESVPLTQTQREAKPELSITKSIKHSDSKIIKNASSKQTSPAESFCETPAIINEFMIQLTRLSSFWHTLKIDCPVQNKTLVKKTVQMLKNLNIPSVAEAIPKMQEKMTGHSDKVCMEILQQHSFYYLYLKFNRQPPESYDLYNEMSKAHAYMASTYPMPKPAQPVTSQAASLQAHNTENVVEENTSRQANTSPTSRKTRRKSCKKPPATDKNVRSTKKPSSRQPKQMASSTAQLSPREVVVSPFESSNLKLVPHDSQHLRTPTLPPPYPPNIRARRDSYRRTSNSSDTCPNVHETREALLSSPTDIVADKIQHQLIMNNLRRQSFEAYAQSEIASYNNYAIHTYRMEKQKEYERLINAQTEYERTMKYNEKSHSGPEIMHQTSGSEHFRQDERLIYPLPILPLDSDVHEKLHGLSKAGCSNQVIKKNAQERYGNRNTSYDSVNNQKSTNLDSTEENKSKSGERFNVCACGIACHDTQEATQLCNFNRLLKQAETKVSENDPPRLSQRRSSEVYLRSSVPNIDLLNKSDSTTDSRLNENNVNSDTCLHVYHEPMPPFEPPSIAKLALTRNPKPVNFGEDTPLDLSCVSRKGQTFDILQASDLSINMCIKDRQSDDASLISRHNIEPLRTHSHHISMPEYARRFQALDNLTREENPTMLLENADRHKNSNLCVENHHEVSTRYTALSTADARTAESDDNSFQVTSINNSHQNRYNDEISKKQSAANMNTAWSSANEYITPDGNYPIPCQLQVSDKHYHDNSGETEDISRPSVQVGKNKRLEGNKYAIANLEVSNDYHLNLGQHLQSQKVQESNIPLQDQRSRDTTTSQNLCDNDTNQNEQDAETARKIAMLPEELVKVLGTIPKDHRNQLLNILPQYVSVPVTNVDTDTKNISKAPNLSTNVTWPDTKENTMVSNEPNRVNTAMSSSIDIPEEKQVLSSSQAQECQNAGESQSTTTLLAPSFVPSAPLTPFGNNESCHPGPHSSYSLEKVSDNSSVDINRHPLSNKIDGNISTGIPTSLAIPTQLTTSTPPTKQKASNEQTASLRAVRIKTTSAKKSFHEDKKMIVNYAYKSNTGVDETCTIPNLVLQDNIHATDLKQDDEKVYKIQNNSCTYISGEATEESVLDPNHIMTNNDIAKENEDVSTNVKHKENKIDVLDKIPEIDLQKASNKCSSQITDSSIDNRVLQLDMSLMKPSMISPGNEGKEKIFKGSPPQSPCDNHSLNNVTDMVIEKQEQTTNKSQKNGTRVVSDSNSDFEQQASVSTDIVDLKQGLGPGSTVLQMNKNDKSKVYTEDPNEEDSEDDIALAIIKRKNSPFPVKHNKDSRGEKIRTKQFKFKEKQKQTRQRKTSKRCKKICSKKASSSSIVSETKVHNASDKIESDVITKLVDTKVNVCDPENKIDVEDNNSYIFPESSESFLNGRNVSGDSNISRLNEKPKENQSLNDMDFPTNTKTDTTDDSTKHKAEIINDKSDNKNEVNNFNLTVKNPMTGDIECTSDYQLCSEVSEVNVIPLRRSRRGKSMYVDSSHLEDNGKNEDNTKATPLTMKRLILSRVEKDKKRISEYNAVETESAEVIIPIDEPYIPAVRKTKQTKRKKSPNSRKSSQKKSRPSSTCEINDDCTDMGNAPSETNSLNLRESHDAENNISDNKSCKNHENCRENGTATCSCCENTTMASKEKENETNKDSQIYDTSKPVKCNLNALNMSEHNSIKSKKSKYENKSQSDFDSDDDKVLLETKQKSTDESVEKNTLIGQDINGDESKELNITRELTLQLTEETVDGHTTNANIPAETRKTCYSKSMPSKKISSPTIEDKINISEQHDPYDIEFDELLEIAKPTVKKKSKVRQSTTHNEKVLGTKQTLINESVENKLLTDQDVDRDTSEEQEITREPTHHLDKVTDDSPTTNSNVSLEIRQTCYSRPLSSQKSRSSSATIKSSARVGTSEQRDPYDIDFDDMLESTKPIVKKRSKVSQSSKLTEHKAAKSDDVDSSLLKISKQVPPKIQPDLSRESDSDSSKSDVPLQKYVEEKELEFKNKYENSRVDKCDERNEEVPEQKDGDNKQTSMPTRPDNAYLIDNEIKRITSTDRATTNYALETPINANTEYFESNVMSVEEHQNKHKPSSKQKKSRRVPTETNDNTNTVPNEVEKLRSKKAWLELISCEKIRRKSNLLATKKITETYHLISNEIDDYTGYKDKVKKCIDNKKKIDVSSIIPLDEAKIMLSEETTALKPVTFENTDFGSKSIASKTDFGETNEANEPDDAQKMDDSDLDSLTAQAIMDSEEVRNLENDLFLGLREAAKANAARNCFMSFQSTSVENTAAKTADQNDPVSKVEDSHSVEHIYESPKKCTKDKTDKPPGYKAKMYPDIEEFDMFEDKFDKIKRKRRSQAVAAKQQVTVETSTRSKSRKQSEKKKIAKTSKKSHQSGLVPTKGALKGFECIKISIPTQDLNLPSNVSPPRQSKKRRKTTIKRRKDMSDSESSCSEFDAGDKSLSVKDIYEFKDSEDAELFDLRPSTVMDRFRSMHSKSKSKHKDREKFKEDRAKSRDKHKRKNEIMSSNINVESKKICENFKNTIKSSRVDLRITEKGDRSESDKNLKLEENLGALSDVDMVRCPSLTQSDDEEYCKISKKGNICEKLRKKDENSSTKDAVNTVAETSAMNAHEGNRVKSREKHKRKKEFTSLDTKTENKKTCVNIDNNKSSARDQREKSDGSETGNCEKNLKPEEKLPSLNKTNLFGSLLPSDDENYSVITKKENQCEKSRNKDNDNVKKDADDAVAGTSGFVPDRIDESDYESEMSSPEGDFIFYTSNDVNCACPSENESNESDTERGCGRLNCLNKNKNADKNTAIGNIFKNNAVRCEKPEVKEPNVHKPDLDQLFDSLLETEKKSNDTGVSKSNVLELEPSAEISVRDNTPVSHEKHHDVVKSKKGDQKKNDIVSNNNRSSKTKSHYQPAHESKNRKLDEDISNKSGYVSSLSVWESDLPQYLSDAEKPKENATCKISSEEYPQENVANIRSTDSSQKVVEKPSKSSLKHGEDYYDFPALEEYPYLLPGETASTCAQVDSKIEESDAESGNESAATKYLKGLTPSEAANMEIYTMVSAQGTQTDKPSPHEAGSSKHSVVSSKDEGELDTRIVPSRRIRLQKYDVREIAQKSKSTKSIQTETQTKDKSEKSFEYECRSDSPTFDQLSPDETGVACQRARRKCTVGKQNVLAEHWSSESEVEGGAARPTSAASTAAGGPHKKKRRKREDSHTATKRAGKGRPRGPKIRARAPRHCWSSEDEAEAGPPPQHGWIVGDSHKKLVTMLAHAKGRKRSHADKRAD